MNQDEINEKIEACQKRLTDFNLQLEILSQKDDISDDDSQAQFDYIIRQIESITSELDSLIDIL
jgi:hypothetical protein